MNEIQYLTDALEAALLHINYLNEESAMMQKALIDQAKINEATLNIVTRHHEALEILLNGK